MTRPTDRSSPPNARWFGVGLLIALVMIQASGCSCRAETEAERAARLAKQEAERIAREEKQREEERLRAPVQLPPARTLPSSGKPASLFAKPGHWNGVVQPAKANAKDFDGAITYEVVSGKDAKNPLGSGHRLVSRRPLVVARESQKTAETLFYCPTDKRSPRLRSIVRERRSGVQVEDLAVPLRTLQDHQYHFVVLAKEPGRYGFLDSLYAVTAPLESRIDTSAMNRDGARLPAAKNYRVVAAPIDDPSGEIELPDNPLAWTTIAYVLWDEVDPSTLRPAQRDALIDWLNWGGQLLVNGPDSLDLLRGSFLEELLPATSAGAREITADELQRFESRWSAGLEGKPLATDTAWSGVALRRASDATSLTGPTNLALERRVGRGRIVVTAMQLADTRLLAWSQGIDNFFNAALLRRPPRRFLPADDYGEPGKAAVAVRWLNKESPIVADPWVNTRVRTFVRDTHLSPEDLQTTLSSDQASVNAAPGAAATSFLSLRAPAVPGGVGAVHDDNAVAKAVRAVLRKSAGVSVPDSGFVVGCLLAYLFVLVPANWGFFAAIGRTELAWVAAPVIALIGGWVVIQQARLDIGFVRARTELAVLELHPETPRGLLTRFTALYASLSTTYQMEFDSPAVAMPFRSAAAGAKRPLGLTSTVAYERQEKARLKDIAVSSTTTEFLRSEEMLDVASQGIEGSSVPGSVRITLGPNGAPRLENRTAWQLEEVMVIGRPDGLGGEPRIEGCWIGDLGPGQFATTAFFPVDPETDTAGEPTLPFQRERRDAAKVRGDAEASRLDLDELIALAIDPSRFEPGERRVIARVSQVMPGVTIEPPSSQRTGATLLVGHLGYGPLPPPKSDANGPLDVQ